MDIYPNGGIWTLINEGDNSVVECFDTYVEAAIALDKICKEDDTSKYNIAYLRPFFIINMIINKANSMNDNIKYLDKVVSNFYPLN